MEILIVNQVGKATPEIINGRDFLIAPMTILVSGVLSGSRGPTWYPPEDVKRLPAVWNEVPITLGHPKVGGEYVLARNSKFLLGRLGMGFLRDTQALDNPARLLTNGCFDVQRTARLDRGILQSLRDGTPIELSTGLEASWSPAPTGAAFNGRGFSQIARDYLPDHLAILPKGRGACSLSDGCGVLVNELSQVHPPEFLTLNEFLEATEVCQDLLRLRGSLVGLPYVPGK